MMKHLFKPDEYSKCIRWLYLAVIILTCLSAVKTIFVGFDRDEAYAVSLAYRIAQGDRLFKELWEPHQTSGFFSAFFIKGYIMLFSTTTGILIYLKTVCLIIHGFISLFLWKVMSSYAHKNICVLGALLYFNLSPKIVMMPEFSMMQVWSITLLILFLMKWADTGYRTKWMIAAALIQCVAVLAYPSCLLVFPAALFIILKHKKWKQAMLFTSICLLLGLAFLGYLLSYLRLEELWYSIQQIIMSDSTHGSDKTALGTTITLDLMKTLLFTLFFVLTSAILIKVSKTTLSLPAANIYFFLCTAAFVKLICEILPTQYNIVSYCSFYFLILLLAFFMIYRRKLPGSYLTPLLICITAFGATLILSNLPLFFSASYMMCAVPVLVIGLSQFLCMENHSSISKGVLPLLLLCFVSAFSRLYGLNSSDVEKTTLLDVGGIVTQGPAAGTLGDYMTAYILNSNYQEFRQYILPGDNLLIVCDNTLDYLNIPDVNISTHSTISTPTYDQQLTNYWTENPSKYPTVVAVDCWYGETKFPPDTWLGKWLEEEFQADELIDGKFLRYYIKRTSDTYSKK